MLNRWMKWSGLLLALGFLISWVEPAMAGPFEGLWHAVRVEEGDTLFYLVIDADGKATLYGKDWNEAQVPVKIAGKEFSYQVQTSGREFDVTGEFLGSGMKGNWLLRHPQFQYSGEWTATRIHDRGDWKPWQALKEKHKGLTLNLLAELASSAVDASNFEEFCAKWRETTEQKYYEFLTTFVYVDEQDAFTEANRAKSLNQLFALAQERKGELERLSGQIESSFVQVREKLAREYPKAQLDSAALGVLADREFDYSLRALSGGVKPVLEINLRTYLALGAAGGDGFLAEALIYPALAAQTRLPNRVPSEFIKRGAAAFLGRKALNLPTKISAPKEKTDLMKQKVLQNLRAGVSGFFREFIAGEQRTPFYSLALEFAESLQAGSDGLTVLWDLNPAVVGPKLNVFLSASPQGSAL